jgi:16S rRNA (cytosine967-C5)-methyltransferase
MKPKQARESASPARQRAYDILLRVETERAYASPLIASLADSDVSREDRALTQEIVLGVLRSRLALDYFIARYCARPIQKMDPPVLIALRIGLYQLRFLSGVPKSAAVNESVKLVKQMGAASAASLVNAVLRKATRHPDETAGDSISDPIERASVELSHPRWMLERWQASLGADECRHLAIANNTVPATAFRVNTLCASSEQVLSDLGTKGVIVRPSGVAPDAYVVEARPVRPVIEAAREGLIYIQDEASQLVSLLLEPRSEHRMLDLCAAPGSKASHIATLTSDQAWIVACDVHPHRLRVLREICKRLGLHSVDPIALDATESAPFIESAQAFDRVLLDAPCSGTGTLRSNPEIKWRLSAFDLTTLAELQFKLLERAAAEVAEDGRLVYSTCSIEREENEEVVKRFLQSNAAFRVVQPHARAELITSEGFVRTYPHKHGCDGFFAAVLERKDK